MEKHYKGRKLHLADSATKTDETLIFIHLQYCIPVAFSALAIYETHPHLPITHRLSPFPRCPLPQTVVPFQGKDPVMASSAFTSVYLQFRQVTPLFPCHQVKLYLLLNHILHSGLVTTWFPPFSLCYTSKCDTVHAMCMHVVLLVTSCSSALYFIILRIIE